VQHPALGLAPGHRMGVGSLSRPSRLCRSTVMPALTFLAMVGLALVALLFVADATLEPSSPLIVTSDRVGLPERWRADTGQTLPRAPAAAPDMTPQGIPAPPPNSDTDAV